MKSLVSHARRALIEARGSREASCLEVRERLATASSRRELLRARLHRHVRGCAGCAEFRREVRRQRALLVLVLPVAPSLGLKQRVLAAAGLGGGGGTGGAGLAAAVGYRGRQPS